MSTADRVDAYRRRMKARGFRPVQIWVPDVRTQAFADEARRQAHIVAQTDTRTDDQTFVESVSARWDDE